jgi:hypothetical protein
LAPVVSQEELRAVLLVAWEEPARGSVQVRPEPVVPVPEQVRPGRLLTPPRPRLVVRLMSSEI